MDFVCKVIGNLVIPDLNLKLSHMEIISLDTEDFKISPRLREALRNREIESFDPHKHQGSRRLKKISKKIPVAAPTPKVATDPVLNDKILKKLDDILKKMDNSLKTISDKLDIIISKESTGMDISALVGKLEDISKGISFGVPSYRGKEGHSPHQKEFKEDIFVPKIETMDVLEKNIKAQEILSEGTDNILEKLKNMKGDLND